MCVHVLQVYITVFADGPTRVLRFADVQNVGAEEAQQSILDLAARLKQVEARRTSTSFQGCLDEPPLAKPSNAAKHALIKRATSTMFSCHLEGCILMPFCPRAGGGGAVAGQCTLQRPARRHGRPPAGPVRPSPVLRSRPTTGKCGRGG